MAQAFSSLSVYRLRSGGKDARFQDFIDPKKKPSLHRLKGRYNFDAELFVAPPDEKPPGWLEPLKVGFEGLNEIPDSVKNDAVLILSVNHGKELVFFAITFGFGRFLLRPSTIERNYGLRVALNAIYPKHGKGQKLDPERLRSVDSKTVAETTLRTRRQVDRISDFERFNVDVERDLLSGLTGTPLETDLWGRRIDGSDAVHVHRAVAFAQLGDICRQFEKYSKKVPRDFEWVDNIFVVREPLLVETLRNRVLGRIRRDDVENLELAPPELVEWSDIDHFAFSFAIEEPFSDPNIEEYVSRLRARNKLDGLTLNQLMSGHRLIAFDADGNEINDWTVFRALSGGLEHRSPTYVLSEGDFFEVKADYMDDLDAALGKLTEFTAELPESRPNWSEDRYNREAAALAGNFLLDKMTVRLTARTTPIEICDVLTSDKNLIHVKRKVNAPSLSHLFSQGIVSADLLLMNAEFRTKARQRIASLERSRHINNRFSKLFPTQRGITASSFTIVFGIIEKWKGKTLIERLPFFSKVNLRRCVHELSRMGYKVEYKRIDIEPHR